MPVGMLIVYFLPYYIILVDLSMVFFPWQLGNGTFFLPSDTAGAVCQLAGPVEQAQVILKVVGVPVALLSRVFAHRL